MAGRMTVAVSVIPVANAFAERLRAQARTYFPELHEPVEVLLISAAPRAYSEIRRLAIRDARGEAREVIVKVFPGAASQFRILTVFWPAFAAHPTWRIPRPLDHLVEESALVMEAAPGRSLHARLPRWAWAGRWLSRAADDCRRAGEWLRFYHDVSRGEDRAPLDVRAKRIFLEESADALMRAGFEERVCRRFVDRLRPIAEASGKRPLPSALLHGDFSLDNVVLDSAHVTGMDIGGRSQNAVQHDLASFVNSLFLLRLNRPAPRSAIWRLREAFLTGYWGGEPGEDPDMLFVQAIGIMDCVLEILSRRSSRVVHAWVKHVVGRTMEDLAGACDMVHV